MKTLRARWMVAVPALVGAVACAWSWMALPSAPATRAQTSARVDGADDPARLPSPEPFRASTASVEGLSPADEPLTQAASPAGVTGRVVGKRGGGPIAGARVILDLRSAQDSPEPSDPPDVVTDDRGVFRFLCLPTPPFRLMAHARGYAPALIWIEAPPAPGDSSSIEIALDEGLVVRARVRTSRDGRVLADAQVWVDRLPEYPYEFLYVPGVRGYATTSPDGGFEIGGLLPGRYSFRVRANGFAWMERVEQVSAGQGVLDEFVLSQGARLRGRIVDAEGHSVSHAFLDMRNESTGATRRFEANVDGRYDQRDLPLGEWVIDCGIRGPGHLRRVELGEGEVRELDFDESRATVLIVTLRLGLQAVPGTWVTLTSLDGSAEESDTTDAEGRALLRALSPGVYELRAAGTTRRVDVGPGPGEQRIEISLPEVAAEGR